MQANGSIWSSLQQSMRCLNGLMAHLDGSGIDVADGRHLQHHKLDGHGQQLAAFDGPPVTALQA